ncbi:MAG TPA: tandem-95 repeat protein, partial [Methylomirabilota bacterium]|nr:tandem-95 repeat protein [Methylomirabilota bacterium]
MPEQLISARRLQAALTLIFVTCFLAASSPRASAQFFDDMDMDGWSFTMGDCNDSNPTVNPGAFEIPGNGIDENCNGMGDDSFPESYTYYTDNDGDGYGNDSSPVESSNPFPGHAESLVGGDCDDSNAFVRPGMAEIPNDGLDNDCNPATPDIVNTFYVDSDFDGHGNPAASVISNDAEPPAGYTTFANADDCDDNDSSKHPGATEIVDNLIDEDCDGADLKTWFVDADADGYGNSASFIESNFQPPGYVANSEDCDDNNVSINPLGIEIPNNDVDENCDGEDLVTAVPEIVTPEDQTTDEDTAITGISVTVNYEGAPGLLDLRARSLHPAVVTDGDITVTGSGAEWQLSITPQPDVSGSAVIELEATDGIETVIATFNLHVQEVNDPPIANGDNFAAQEDEPVVVTSEDLITNDQTGPIGEVEQSLVILSIAPVTPGALVSTNASGDWVLSPPADFNGVAEFSYVVQDDPGAEAQGEIELFVSPVNDAPIAQADQFATDEDVPVVITHDDLLANDFPGPSDESEQSLAISVISPVTEGASVATNHFGQLVFTPPTNHVGVTLYSYTLVDAFAASSSGVIEITTTEVNDEPIAGVDGVTGGEDEEVEVDVEILLSNDLAGPGTEITQSLTFKNIKAKTAGATVTTNAVGKIILKGPKNHVGLVEFEYDLEDSEGAVTTGIVDLVTTAVNDAPLPELDLVSGNEDDDIEINLELLLSNDDPGAEDEATQSLMVKAIRALTPGATVTTNGAGKVILKGPKDHVGLVQFEYDVEDNEGGLSTGTIDLTTSAVNDAPLAEIDLVSGDEDADIEIEVESLLANDGPGADNETGQTLKLKGVRPLTAGATVSTNGAGKLVLKGPKDFVGVVQFEYDVEDNEGGLSTGTIDLTTAAVNDAPLAEIDLVNGDEDADIEIEVETLLANDGPGADNETGQTLKLKGVRALTPGATVSTNGAGKLVLKGPKDFVGVVQFEYDVEDNEGGLSTGTIDLTTSAVNDAPLAESDLVSGDEDADIEIEVETLLANDGPGADNETGQTLKLKGVRALTAGATVSTNGAGKLVLKGPKDFVGVVQFEYDVEDNEGGLSTGTIDLTTAAVNDAPLAEIDLVSGDEDADIEIAVESLLANDGPGADNETGQTLKLKGVRALTAGATVSTNGAGKIVLKGPKDFVGVVQFEYDVEDNEGGLSTGTIDLTTAAVNDAPLAEDDSFSTDEDSEFEFDLAALLNNDNPGAENESDQSLAVDFIIPLTEGAQVFTNGAGKIVLKGPKDHAGIVQFQYQLADNQGGKGNGLVSLLANALNDPPVPAADSLSTLEDVAIHFSSATVLGNDSAGPSNEVQALELLSVEEATTHGGVVVLNGDGSFTYTPPANFNGQDTVTYRVADVEGSEAEGAIEFTVTEVNDGPTAAHDIVPAAPDTSTDFSASMLLGNDTGGPADEAGQALQIMSVSPVGSRGGVLVWDADAQRVTYTPPAGFRGVDTFTYLVADNGTTAGAPAPQQASGTVQVLVGPVSASFWMNPAGGDWNDAVNWSDSILPTSESTAIVGLAGNYIITLDDGATVENLYIGGSGVQALLTAYASWSDDDEGDEDGDDREGEGDDEDDESDGAQLQTTLKVTGEMRLESGSGFLVYGSQVDIASAQLYGTTEIDAGVLLGSYVNHGVFTATSHSDVHAGFTNANTGVMRIVGREFGSGKLAFDRNVSNEGTIELTNEGADWEWAKLQITDGALLNSGTLTLSAGGGGERFLYAEVNNSGAINIHAKTTWSKADADHVNSGAINVGDDVEVALSQWGDSPSFLNSGTINVGQGTMDVNMDWTGLLTSSGSILIANGRLTIEGGEFQQTGGTVQGGSLVFESTSATLLSDYSLGDLELSHSTVSGSAKLTTQSDTYAVVHSSVVSNLVQNAGAIEITGQSAFQGGLTGFPDSALFLTATSDESATLVLGGAIFENHGLIDLLAESADHVAELTVNGELLNFGEITFAGPGESLLNAVLINEGGVFVNAAATIASADAPHLNSGTITVLNGGALELTHGGFSGFINEGSLSLLGGKLAISLQDPDAGVENRGGVHMEPGSQLLISSFLTNTPAAHLLVSGVLETGSGLFNSGLIDPAGTNAGSIAIRGPLVAFPSSKVYLDVVAPGQHDTISLDTAPQLRGSLELFGSAESLGLGDAVSLISYPLNTTRFDYVQGTSLDAGERFEVHYLPASLTVRVTDSPVDVLHGMVRRELFAGIPGGSISDMLRAPGFRTAPVLVSYQPTVDHFDLFADYGARFTGYITPPVSGEYQFYLAGDDSAALYLSSDENPVNAVLIAAVDSWTSEYEYNKPGVGPNISTNVLLEAGRSYYFEALHKQGPYGAGHIALAWRMPGAEPLTNGAPVIPSEYLSVRSPENPGINYPPYAHAGPDIAIYATAPGSVAVTLNGLESNDPEKQPLTYTWTGAFGEASGVQPTVDLPQGFHTVTLTVTDDFGGQSSDTVVVSVLKRLTAISVNPADATVQIGKTQQFEVVGAFSDGSEATLTGAESHDIPAVTYDRFVRAEGIGQIRGLAYDRARDRLWAYDPVAHVVRAFQGVLQAPAHSAVTPVTSFTPSVSDLHDGEYYAPTDLVYFTTGTNGFVAGFDASGNIVEQFDSGMAFCDDFTIVGDLFFVAGNSSAQMRVYKRTGPNAFEFVGMSAGDSWAAAYDEARNVIWILAYREDGQSDFKAYSPVTGLAVTGPFKGRYGINGRALAYAGEDTLIEGTHTGTANGFKLWRVWGAGKVEWSSSSPSVATIDNAGLATWRSAGESTITAKVGGHTAFAQLTATLNLTGVLKRERYDSVYGSSPSLQDLRLHPAFPHAPSYSDFIASLESQLGDSDNYGMRIRGHVVPPTTGDYVFHLASDDVAELWLSTDDQPVHARIIASTPEWTGVREYNKFPSAKSAPVYLEAGKKYYIETLMIEASIGDHVAVAWQKPGDGPVTDGADPISSEYLSFFGDYPAINQPPVADAGPNQRHVPAGAGTFGVTLDGSASRDPEELPMSYQWRSLRTLDPVAAVVSTQAIATLHLPIGVHEFELTVTDSTGASASDRTMVKVLPELVGVEYAKTNYSFFVGQTQQVAVHGRYSNGSVSNLPPYHPIAHSELILDRFVHGDELQRVDSLGYDPARDRLWVVDQLARELLIYEGLSSAAHGSSLPLIARKPYNFPGARDGEYSAAHDLFFVPTGNNGEIAAFDADGNFVEAFDSGLANVAGLSVAADLLQLTTGSASGVAMRRLGPGSYSVVGTNVFPGLAAAYDAKRALYWMAYWRPNGASFYIPWLPNGDVLGGLHFEPHRGPYGFTLAPGGIDTLIEGTHSGSQNGFRVFRFHGTTGYTQSLSPTNIVTAPAHGALFGLAPGQALLTATADGFAGSSTATVLPRPTNDLSVSIVASPRGYQQGENVRYTITVTNAGPDIAMDVLVDQFPGVSSLVLTNYTPAPFARGASNQITWKLDQLPPGQEAVFTSEVTPFPSVNGVWSMARVSSAGIDLVSSNDSLWLFTPKLLPPTAVGDVYTINEDSVLVVTNASGVLVNDTDPNGDTLSAIATSSPANGALQFSANGTFTYTPNPNFFGTNHFTYKASDGLLLSSNANVFIYVLPVNDAPVAHSNTLSVLEDGSVQFQLTGSDVDSSLLSFSIVQSPLNGAISSATGTNRYIYRPATNFFGSDQLRFMVTDGSLSNVATIRFTVAAVNDVPVAFSQHVNVAEDDSILITLNAIDVETPSLGYVIATPPTHGSIVRTAVPNVVRYVPLMNYHGNDSFSFKVNDGGAQSAPATVTINVTPLNDIPIARADTAEVNEDDSVLITLSGSDAEGQTLAATIVGEPENGTLSTTDDANVFRYQPNTNFFGSDLFTFTVSDGDAHSEAASIAITVHPVNDAPIAESGTATVNEDGEVEITLAASDVEGSDLTYIIVAEPGQGTLTATAVSNVFTYKPAADYTGSDSFSFEVNDGELGSGSAVVTIDVTPVNDAPVGLAANVEVNEDNTVLITMSGSDTEGQSLTGIITAEPVNGTLTATEEANVYRYQPNTNFFGSDLITFTVNDGEADSEAAAIVITVHPVNDAPVAHSGTA